MGVFRSWKGPGGPGGAQHGQGWGPHGQGQMTRGAAVAQVQPGGLLNGGQFTQAVHPFRQYKSLRVAAGADNLLGRIALAGTIDYVEA